MILLYMVFIGHDFIKRFLLDVFNCLDLHVGDNDPVFTTRSRENDTTQRRATSNAFDQSLYATSLITPIFRLIDKSDTDTRSKGGYKRGDLLLIHSLMHSFRLFLWFLSILSDCDVLLIVLTPY